MVFSVVCQVRGLGIFWAQREFVSGVGMFAGLDSIWELQCIALEDQAAGSP